MGFVGNAISSVLGAVTGGNSPAPVVAPVTVEEEIEDVTSESERAKKLRSALTATAGGMSGEEVLSTSRRSGLFGN